MYLILTSSPWLTHRTGPRQHLPAQETVQGHRTGDCCYDQSSVHCLNLCYVSPVPKSTDRRTTTDRLLQYGVVPYKDQTTEEFSIVTEFFAQTLASQHSRQVVAAFMSFSSLGNIIIQTFTAARDKLACKNRRSGHYADELDSEAGTCQRGNLALFEVLRPQPLLEMGILEECR